MKVLPMRFLRTVWKDILWLDSHLGPRVKIAALILSIALIVGGWYLGADWWAAPMRLKYKADPVSHAEAAVFYLGLVLICYRVRDRP